MKTNYLKTILSSRLITVVLFFSSFSAAFGQELIFGARDVFLCDTSIIRVKTNDSILVYNRRDTPRSVSTIMLFSSGLSYIPTVYLDSVYINDFERYGERYYFCGYKLVNGQKKAVVGNFDHTAFPNTTFHYAFVDTCTELKKMDVYYLEEYGIREVHLVMTGTRGSRSDVILDYKLGSPYFCQAYFSNDEKECFDDVAVTKNYVVVSSRKEENGIPLVVFRRYYRPTLLGESIFLMPINNLVVSSPVACTPVYLEYEVNNEYAAVYRISGYFRMTMLKMDAPSPNYKSVEIFGDDAHTIHPIDIKFNKGSLVYDLLAWNESAREIDHYFEPPMQIYHITPAVINNTVSYGEGTRFIYNENYYRLWTIDPLKSSYYFVASGDFGQLPRVYRYKHNEWEKCPERFEYSFDVGDLKGIERIDETLKFEEYRLLYDTIDFSYLKIDLDTVCGHKGAESLTN